ncbi:MAG: hypothetical protein VKM98_05140 [Cyanobacteriota bacterium]|nr:hypothetical protein [Cyanobacteriota bacterium]
MPQRPVQPATRRRNRAAALSLVLIALAAAGCSRRGELPNVLYVSIGSYSEKSIDTDLIEGFRKRLGGLEYGYRELHPATRFQFTVDPEADLVSIMRRRTRAGLGPDLLVVNGDTSRQLLEAGVSDPYPADAARLASLHPSDAQRLSDRHGRLSGLPLLVQTQLACYNRSRLPTAPANLNELLKAGARRHPLGLTTELGELFWTAGSLGAIDGLAQALAGRQPSTQQRQGIQNWLTWLQEANNQMWVTFFGSQSSMDNEFVAGRLDWMPCRSTSVPTLRKRLGNNLGVAPLPSGPSGPASPINRLRVLVLGKNSSAQGRRRALAFGHYALNPLSQRTLTVGSQTVLPANRYVTVPIGSSATLRAMATAAHDGLQANPIIRLVHTSDPRIPAVQTVLTGVVFGELAPRSATTQLIRALRPQR